MWFCVDDGNVVRDLLGFFLTGAIVAAFVDDGGVLLNFRMGNTFVCLFLQSGCCITVI